MMQGRARRALSPGGLPTCMAANSSVVPLLNGGVAEASITLGTNVTFMEELEETPRCAPPAPLRKHRQQKRKGSERFSILTILTSA